MVMILSTSAFFGSMKSAIPGSTKVASSFYDVVEKDSKGKDVKFDKFKGKVVYGVNVASKCGYTSSGYALLEKISAMDGVEVALFPCNQFGGQEPGSESEIKEFCSSKFGVTFPMYSKIEVNGPGRHPLYEAIIGADGPLPGNVKWNFGKILVGKDGKPIDRFGSMTSPSSRKLIQVIEKALEG